MPTRLLTGPGRPGAHCTPQASGRCARARRGQTAAVRAAAARVPGVAISGEQRGMNSSHCRIGSPQGPMHEHGVWCALGCHLRLFCQLILF